MATLGADAFLRVAVAAADLPPVLEGVDPAALWVAEEKERWEGVRS